MTIARFIRGTIVESGSGGAGAGLVVRLGSLSGRSTSSIAETTTDEAGRFCFEVTTLAGRPGGGARYRLDVYADATLLGARGDVSVSSSVDAEGLVIEVTRPAPVAEVSDDPPGGLQGFSDEAIHGVVRHVDGGGLEGLVVKLCRRAWSDLGATTPPAPLDTSLTLSGGWYCFDALAETGFPLYVEVWQPEGEDPPTSPIGRSRMVYGYRGGSRRIDVTVNDSGTRRDSEFKRLDVALSKAIFPGAGEHPVSELGAALMALDPERAAWLEGQTGWSMERITERTLAEKLAAELGDEACPLDPEALYALLRQGLTGGAAGLLGQAPSRITRAMATAASDNLISSGLSAEQTLTALRASRLKRQTGTGETSLGAILRSSAELNLPGGLSEAQVKALCELQADFEGTDEAFWTAAQALAPFTGQPEDPALAEAKRLIRLGSVALGHAPTQKAILGELGSSPAEEIADWDDARWAEVAIAVNPLPSDLPGDDETERRENLAALLKEHAELSFPARVLQKGLGREGSPFQPDNWGSTYDDIDVRSCRLTDDDPPEVHLAQRLCRVAPSLNAVPSMEKLYHLEFRSARDIARTGRARFLDTWAAEDDPVGRAEALEIFRKAQSQAGLAAAFFLQAHPALVRAPASFMPPSGLDGLELPSNWDKFFGQGASGGGDYVVPPGTRGDWCASIHGPSAYLVDLLDWLSDKSRPWSLETHRTSALDALVERRPDIPKLPLTCPNATRSLPYVDLVLEVLEDVVANGKVSDEAPPSSEVGTEEMLAAPQYINEIAYGVGKLGDARRTFLAPFHRPLHEARAFLAHLGIDRTDLMRLHRDSLVDEDFVPSDMDIACEELGLSVEGAAAIMTVGDEADFWCLPNLEKVPTLKELRRAAGIGYTELLDLTHTRAVHDAGELAVGMGRDDDPFDASSYVLHSSESAPSSEQFRALRRMIRLWRATGWTLLETDKVLHALASEEAPMWGEACMQRVGELHRLVRMTGEEPTEVAAWFADIDTFQDRETADVPVQSLYDRVFLNPAVFPSSESTEDSFPFRLNEEDRGEVVRTDSVPTVSWALGRLRSVLGQDQAELGALLLDLHEDSWGELPLSLALLSELYRWCSLARVLGLKPTEAWRLARCMGRESVESAEDDGVFASPSSAAEFLEIAGRLRDAGMGVDELEYLLMHEARERIAPTEERLQGILGRLRDTALAQDPEASQESRQEALRDQLASELGISRRLATDLDARMWVGSALEDGDEEEPFPCFLVSALRYPPGEGSLELEGTLSITLTEPAEVVQGTEPEILPVGTTVGVAGGSAVQAILLSAGTPCVFVSEGAIAIAEELSAGTRFEFASGLSVSLAGASLPLTSTLIGSITPPMELELGALPLASMSNASALCARFLAAPYTSASTAQGTNPWADITRDDLDWKLEFAVMEALLKAAALVTRLGVNDDEREALRDATTDWGVLDPAILFSAPLERRMIERADAFGRMLRGLDLFAQRRRLPGSSPTFAELLLDPSVSAIAARTGWDPETLEGFAPDGVTGVLGLKNLLSWMGYHRSTGASVEALVRWSAPGSLEVFTRDTSRSVVSAARSRSATAQAWASVARPIRDRVRKAQRDALVSYLIAESGGTLDDADALYEHLLIDVSMNPEMLTSRVVQAACSVQLFVHRALFGLEAAETCRCFNDEDREEWEWMRSYRVWEAARKVLLYPENWIEPELRDDKSTFFEALEKDLAQGDLSEDRVGSLAVDYLDRLAGVANLEVMAYYVERESDVEGTIDRLHVFARTRGLPTTWWYRRRDDGATWTPWEKMEVGIEGKHLIPVVYERRLLLFWAEFTEVQSDESQEGDPKPARWWEIRLAMSERQDGRWTPKTLFSEALNTREKTELHKAEDAYAFVSSMVSNALTVTCLALRNYDSTRTHYFGELGQFDLDPLANSLLARPKDEDVHINRLALAQNDWSAPGYLTSGIVSDGSLSVYRGDADEEGYLVGSASLLSLLGTCADAVVVLPSQWDDYVSQAPFFVVQTDHAWFVEPSSAADLRMSTSISSESPSLSTLALRREGTRRSDALSLDLDEVLSEDEAEGLTGLLGAHSDLSRPDAICRLRETALNLQDEGFEVDAVSVPGRYRFSPFYHPFVAEFRKEVRRNGIFGLLAPNPNGQAQELFRQRMTGDEDAFRVAYVPTFRVETPLPQDEIDFSESGAYAGYNWELFFHLPFLVARRLSDEGKYEEALRYFHAIFDPRTRTPVSDAGDPDPTTVAQWWRIKPFLEPVSTPVTSWLAFTGADGDEADRDAFERQVDAWREDPFNPHLLARLRPGVYQRAIVMAYLDTLLAWGDHLFTRDTLESLNEATQLYVYAKQVLGERPALFEKATSPSPLCYEQLADDLDAAGNALVAIENASFSVRGFGVTSHLSMAALRGLQRVTYFNVPYNAKLLSYWDTIEDRLFKIRNGMNLEGVVRSLPLFSPPIDPGMLVRAAAAGVDIGSILDELSGTPGPYRFMVMLGRAQALAGTVRALGQALLSALEKRDGEALALLRQEHEGALLDAIQEVRTRQVDEAQASLQAARRSRKLAVARRDYYAGLIEEGMIAQEHAAMAAMLIGEDLRRGAATIGAICTTLYKLPQVMTGLAAAIGSGGLNAGAASQAASRCAKILAEAAMDNVGSLTTWATYKRRAQEWKHQKKQAKKEIDQIDKQIEAARIRKEIAERELANHELQVRHSAEVREWMESKYTRQELYDWMVGQLCALHFQAWQLAYAAARKAERCFNFELGSQDAFIKSVHWDASRRGLLAGERLAMDLDRMDAAWHERDVREHEMVKHVSLQTLDPFAVASLQENGYCYFEIPDALFSLDCPSHYFRRLQSVAISLACVTGPLATVNTRLTLLGSWRRSTPTGELTSESYTDTPSIVTSVATQDGGVFQFDPKDPRYLPFERRGAASRWRLEFTAEDLYQFDWKTLEDVVIHVKYTARYDESAVVEATSTIPLGLTADSSTTEGVARAVSLRTEFPDAFAAAEEETELSFEITSAMILPFTRARLKAVYVIPVMPSGSATAPADCTLSTVAASGASKLGDLSFFGFSSTPSIEGEVDLSFSTNFGNFLDVILVMVFQ